MAQSTALAVGTQSAALITADNSSNANYAYNGLLTTALGSTNAYITTMATGTAGTGTPLTASGRGSINEIDTMFQKMWDTFELRPTVHLRQRARAQEHHHQGAVQHRRAHCCATTTRPGPATSTASPRPASCEYYYNPFAIQGGLRIPIRIHPNVPPGTIIGWAENLPIQYQSNEVPNVAEVKTRQDYYQVDCSK